MSQTARRLFAFVIAVLALVANTTVAGQKIRVVTTIPDLADFTRQIGRELVEVSSLATGVEDIHAVPMKPTFVVLLNRADVVVLVGLETEHMFLPGLLAASRNPKIQRDGPGYVDASIYVPLLEVPTRLDRALGDQHPMGNPHINLDPVRAKAMVRAIADGLSRNFPEHTPMFQKNAAAYLQELDAAIVRWQEQAAPLRGKRMVSYHPDLIYFAERFGIDYFGTIEARPGIDPSPSRVADLVRRMKEARVEIVVREMHYPAGLAERVAKTTGARLVELPAMGGGLPQTKTYIRFIDYNLRTLLKAVTE
jgi:zinc/manganese transport system substrate-binding protein